MMALFIVLWLLNTSKPLREAIAGYFRDPAGTAGELGTSAAGPGAQVVVARDDMTKLKDEIEKAIRQMPNFDNLKDHIEIKVTSEGLRIELLESAAATFFNLGNPVPNENGKELLNLFANQLGKLPNKISIERHTDSKPELGTLDRPRQLRSPPDAAGGSGRETGSTSSWLRRSVATQAE
jgi:chemotaxis protein MotB